MSSGVYVRVRNNGISKRPLYAYWHNIRSRCNNPNTENFCYYGAKGVKMCAEWENDYYAFEKWCIETGHKKGLSLDRIKLNEGYGPDNCRWASPKQQARNRSNNVMLSYNGESRCAAEWAEIIGVTNLTIWNRTKKGLPIEKILSRRRVTA